MPKESGGSKKKLKGKGGGHGFGVPAVPWDKPKQKYEMKFRMFSAEQERANAGMLKAVRGIGKNLKMAYNMFGKKKR